MMKLALRLGAVAVGIGLMTGCGPGLTSRFAKAPDATGTTELTSAAELPMLGRMADDHPYGVVKHDNAPQMANDFPYGGEPAKEPEPTATWGQSAEAPAAPPAANPYSTP
jgi:hypothetical protein